jgi:hypothetical protein
LCTSFKDLGVYGTIATMTKEKLVITVRFSYIDTMYKFPRIHYQSALYNLKANLDESDC